jgi:predicted RNA-binding Zn-ribbon protein involved in translation (DUF1610 family)
VKESVVYLLTVECPECGDRPTIASEGPHVPIDQEAPSPSGYVVEYCPSCGVCWGDWGAHVVEDRVAQVRDPHELEAEVEA